MKTFLNIALLVSASIFAAIIYASFFLAMPASADETVGSAACTGFEGTKANMEATKEPGISIEYIKLSPEVSRGFLDQLRKEVGNQDLMKDGTVVGFAHNNIVPSLIGVFVYDDRGCHVGANIMTADQITKIFGAQPFI